MTSAPTISTAQREPTLRAETVVVIVGSAGTGVQIGRLARAEGAEVIRSARNLDRLQADTKAAKANALSLAGFGVRGVTRPLRTVAPVRPQGSGIRRLARADDALDGAAPPWAHHDD